jgi:hypothetical protein
MLFIINKIGQIHLRATIPPSRQDHLTLGDLKNLRPLCSSPNGTHHLQQQHTFNIIAKTKEHEHEGQTTQLETKKNSKEGHH